MMIRHAEPRWGHGVLLDDPGLSDRGRAQCVAAAGMLAERYEAFDYVVVSDTERTRQTFDELRRDETPLKEEWLQDIRTPDWSGLPTSKVRELIAGTRDWSLDRQWESFDGGETAREFVSRVRESFAEFLIGLGVTPVDHELAVWDGADQNTDVLLVGHKGSLATIIAYLLGLPPSPWEWDRFVLGHASLTVLSTARISRHSVFSVRQLGDQEHLAMSSRTL